MQRLKRVMNFAGKTPTDGGSEQSPKLVKQTKIGLVSFVIINVQKVRKDLGSIVIRFVPAACVMMAFSVVRQNTAEAQVTLGNLVTP